MRLVLVTGATRGLGLAIARSLAESGEYRVIGTGRKVSDALSELMEQDGFRDRLIFRALDLNHLEEIHSFIVELTKDYGSLYALVNNAALGHDGLLATMHEKDIAELITVNLEAPVLLSKYASRSMFSNLEGRIIQVSSIVSGTGFKGLSVYGATKAGLIGLTKSLARELAKVGITVNAVLPGFLETDMTSMLDIDQLSTIRRRSPSGKLAELKDVAAAIRFLLSDEAKSITGTTLTIDAGSAS